MKRVASIRKLARTHFWCHQDVNLGVKVSFCLPECMNKLLLSIATLNYCIFRNRVKVFHRRLLGRNIPDAVEDS